MSDNTRTPPSRLSDEQARAVVEEGRGFVSLSHVEGDPECPCNECRYVRSDDNTRSPQDILDELAANRDRHWRERNNRRRLHFAIFAAVVIAAASIIWVFVP